MKPNTPKGKDPLKDRIFINTLFDFKEVDLYDLHDRLWYEHFTPVRALTKDERNFIRTQLNLVGAEIKINAETAKNPCAEVVIVQTDTKFEPDELGPNRKEVIYIDVEEPLKLVSSFKSRSGKTGSNKHASMVLDEDLLGDGEDEDLLGGDSKPIKGKRLADSIAESKNKAQRVKRVIDPNKVTATSIYPELAKLANKLGDSADKISKAKPEWPRKCITDALWKWRKSK